MIIGLVVNDTLRNVGRHEDRWDAQAEPVELEDRLGRILAIGVDSTQRWLVIVEAPVFIGQDDEQTLVPERRVPQRFVDLRNEGSPRLTSCGGC